MKNCPALCPFSLHLPADTREAVAPTPPARVRGAVAPSLPRAAPRRLSEKARIGRCITLVFALTLLAILALVIADLQTPAEARQGDAQAVAPAQKTTNSGGVGPDERGIGGLRVVVQKGHVSPVNALAVSPDGKFLVSGSDDNTIKIWDVETGLLIRTIEVNDWILALAITPDGKTIVAGGADSTVSLYGINDGALKKVLGRHDYRVLDMAIADEGNTLVTAGADKTLRAWRLDAPSDAKEPKNGRIIARDFTGAAIALAVAPDRLHVAVGAQGANPLRIYNVRSLAEKPAFLDSGSGEEDAVAFSPNGAALASAGVGQQVRLWNARTHALIATLPFNDSPQNDKDNPIEDVKWSPDGTRLVALSRSGDVATWEVSPVSGKPIGARKRFQTGQRGGAAIAFLPASAKFATAGGSGGDIRLWDAGASGAAPLRAFSSKQGPDTRYYYEGRGSAARLIAFDVEKGRVRRTDLVTGAALPVLATDKPDSEAEAVTFSPSGALMAYTHTDALLPSIRIVDAATGKEVAALPLKNGRPVDRLTFSADEKSIAALTRTYDSFAAWNIETGKPAYNALSLALNLMQSAFSFSPNGKYMAVSNNLDSRLQLWDTATGSKIRDFELDRPQNGGETADLFAWSPDSAQLISSDHFGDVATWNVATGKFIRRITANKGWLLSLAVSPDGKFIASGGVDRVLKFWGLADSKQRAMRFAVDENDWVVVTPEGRFDGTEQGFKEIHYIRANRPIPLESFFERFFTPHLLAQVLTGAKPVLPTPAPVADIKLPPRVEIVSPRPGAQSALADVTVNVEVTDQGGGIAETLLYQNGKLVNRDTRALVKVDDKTGAFTKTFAVTLLPGVNVLRATAFNKDRTESAPSEVIVNLAGSATETADADLYIVAVGINGYTNPKYRLTYATPDAQAFTEAVEASGKNIFRRIVKTEVFDDRATRANIEAAINQVAKNARPQDAFVLYYSGHGVMSEGEPATGTAIAQPAEFFLACADLTQFTSDDDLKAKGVSATRMRDLCLSVKAQKQLIVLDACQSGGAVDVFATRGVPEEKAIAQLARSAGVMVLSAALSQQAATELTELKHGVFTYALMQGLRGEADGGKNPDGKITVGELKTFVSDRVPELSKKYQSQAQYPSGFSRGQDFPLGVTGK